MTKHLQICLASTQLQPNLIPLLEPGFKPDTLWILASEKMTSQAAQLKNIATDLQIKTTIPSAALPSANYNKLREYFLDLLSILPEDCRISVNVTGGNKLMTLAAADILQEVTGIQFLYCDTNNQQIEILNLSNLDGPQQPLNFTKSLTLKQVLACGMAKLHRSTGSDPNSRQRMLDRADFCKLYCRYAVHHPHQIRELNHELGKLLVRHRLKSKSLGFSDNMHRSMFQLFANSNGQIDYNPDSQTLHLTDAEQAQWLQGKWLEEYIWHTMRSAKLPDTDTGIELHWTLPESRARFALSNEIDAIAIKNNRICLVEAKTGRIEERERQDIVHKLARLRDQIAGPFGTAMIASLHAPDDVLRDRARHNRVQLIYGQQLLQLPTVFANWASSREPMP